METRIRPAYVGAALLFIMLAPSGCGVAPVRQESVAPETQSALNTKALLLSPTTPVIPAGEIETAAVPGILVPNVPEVNRFLAHYRSKRQFFLSPALSRRHKYLPAIERIFIEHGLPIELADIALLESGFDPNARSPKGAVGLWQFVSSTARQYGLKVTGKVDERRDILKATEAAARHLKDLHRNLGDWYLAVAAFNAGEGALLRAIKKAGSRDFMVLARKGCLTKETTEFVPRFLAISLLARDVSVYDTPAVPVFARTSDSTKSI